MENLFSDLANGKYKLKNSNNNAKNVATDKSSNNLFSDLANGKYTVKKNTSQVSSPQTIQQKMDNLWEEEQQVSSNGVEIAKGKTGLPWTLEARMNNVMSKPVNEESIKHIKETSPILNPEKYHKETDLGYYGGKAVEGMFGAMEGLLDTGAIAGKHIVAPAMKKAEEITSLNGIAPNALSKTFGNLEETYRVTLPEKAMQENPTQLYSDELNFKYNKTNKAERFLGDVVSGTAGMIPTIGVNLVAPGAGYGVLGAQAFGGGTQQAYQKTGELGAKEELYGLLNGLAEVGVEKISGGIGGLGDGAIDKIASKMIKNGFIRNATGEGIEEAVTTFIDPYLQRLTYDKEATGGITDAETWKEALRNALIGSLTSMVLQAPSSISDTTKQIKSTINSNSDTRKLNSIDSTTQSQLEQINNNLLGNEKIDTKNKSTEEIKSELEKLIPMQKNNVPQSPQTELNNTSNQVIPSDIQTAQNDNMGQTTQSDKVMDTLLGRKPENAQNPVQIKAEETLKSAQQAGMTDIDINKAKELNNLLQSNARLQFYDENNLPQGFSEEDIKKVKIANGLYLNGTIYINKNSKNVVEKILGHELTHHLETAGSFNDLANTVLDSDVFYDYMTEKGFKNVQEFKQSLLDNGYSEQQIDNEMVARFVEDNLFSNQESINRIARKNATLAEKIKNFISDLKVKLKGTAQEKQLLKIENMYRTALEQARSTKTTSADAQYSVGGVIGAKNIQKNPKYRDIMNDYEEANRLIDEGKSNAETVRRTGWFKDTDGNIKYEFTDEDMKLKDSYKFDDNKMYPLTKILKHDILFEAYPQLRDYTVIAMDIGDQHKAAIFGPLKVIMLNNTKLKTKEQVEYSLIHEIQHAIQNIEGFPGARTNINGKYAYYTSLGEIESRDTSNRLKMLAEERRVNLPETAKENPTHPGLEDYLKNRKQKDIEKDNKYVENKERRESLKESIKKFMEGRIGFEEDNISDIYEATSENGELSSRNDGRGRLAGKEPAFSLPETDNQGRKLSKEQQEFFKDSKVRDEDGNLQVVYHGTGENFTVFSDKFMGKNNGNALGQGYYFSSSRFIANSYKGTSNGELMEVYLNIQKPFDFFGEGDLLDKAEYLKNKYGISQIEGKLKFNLHALGLIKSIASENNITTSEILQDLGYDGIISGNEYIAFEPNQIKNVDNTKPTSNPDIRYSKNPVEIAKNPPNPQTGLDKLQKSRRVKEGDTQSNFTKNVLNQNIFDEKFKDLALNDSNIRSYDRITNKETLQKANDAINEQGQKWVDRFKKKASGEMKAEDIAGGFILMNRYQQVGDYESMISIAEKLREAGTQQGQTIQMFSVLGRMTPEGMTYYAQKTLSEAYDEILKNKTQAWADEHADDFKLTEKDIEFIQRRVNQASRLPEGRDKYVLLGEIAARIQNKIPPESGQSMKALARISMLLNSKTMIRNILGNIVIVPNHIVSDFIGSAIDKNISKKTGIRTTGTFTMQALTGIKKGVYESFDDFRRGISTREIAGDRFEIGQGKSFNENHTGKFSAQRNKLNKALNGLDRVTGFLLETGDRPIYETWFINSLNNQMKLNNVKEPTAEMIEIATDEALQRTWQDNNTYTKAVNSVRKALNNFNIKGYGLGDMVMPFVKTPANLTKAVVDFSPLGAINAALKTTQFNKDIDKGIATSKQQREVVKAWSQVITGSLGMAIMTALANAGILTGGSAEDKDVRNFEQNVLGIKPYSIKIGDKTFTYDWAQPLGTTAAMITDTVNSLKNAKDTESKTTAILNGLQSGASVLLDQSFVSGIRNLFEEDNLINALIETGFNEGAKFTPQFLSQIAQLQDDTARTSYVYNNIPQTAVNKIKAKIPGLRQTLEPSVDVLGREVKTDNSIFNILLNPTNTGKTNSSKEAEEMYKVYKDTGDKATIAPVAPYYITVDSQKIVLSPKQRTQYQKTTGQIALESIDNLLKNNSYTNSNSEEKAEVLKEIYSYANAVAKTEVSDYELSEMYKDIQKSGADVADVLIAREIVAAKNTRDEKEEALVDSGYSKTQARKFLDWLNKNTNAIKKVDGKKVRKENYLKNVF
jgi:ribosomal protein L17